MRFHLSLVTLLLCWVSATRPANVLMLLNAPSRSHHIWNSALVTALAERGHNVTVLVTLPVKNPGPNITSLVLEGMYEFVEEQEEFDLENMTDTPPSEMLDIFFEWVFKTCEFTFKNKGMKTLLNYPDNFKFDLLIYEASCGECLLGLAKRFGSPPAIGVSGFSHPHWIDYMFGNPNNPAYISNIMLPYSDHMTFSERMHNFLFNLWVDHLWNSKVLPNIDATSRKYLGPSSAVPSQEIIKVSAVMVNTHPSFDNPRPLVPSVVNVAGIHVKEPKPLPKDLQEYLDNAKEGVVFFSLGSNLQSKKLKEEKRQAILSAFAELPEKVLWKWEADILPGQPKNVKVGKWLPQTDILAHPNVRLFITHSGLLSTQESIHRGVPMLGIPFFADQQINIEKSMRHGVGLRLDYNDITKESLLKTIRSVIDDPSYAKNMRELSSKFRDRPETPLETAVFWCEYVMRHKGAPHLRSAAKDLYLFQYLLLDVIAFASAATLVPVLLLCYCCKKIFSKKLVQNKIKKN
ncbi:UDP-glycosyltransferase UGT5 [Anabrus simplex]|uniref:UDP-glycosyltransferase UGT5 n=1 Tax=Anabrus simplex TaxID=316456 RepID=UPI0035A2D2DA